LGEGWVNSAGLDLKQTQQVPRNYLCTVGPIFGSFGLIRVQYVDLFQFTPDHHVILDRHPTYRNVIIGAGFSGHGFKLAPVVGRILGSLAAQRDDKENAVKEYDLSEVSISRFTDKGTGKSTNIRHMM
jgi:glycine/D-amino acid oxidase-like deaminating enzyme